MFMKSTFLGFACFGLLACGGGGTDGVKSIGDEIGFVPLNAAPANVGTPEVEQGAGLFTGFFSRSKISDSLPNLRVRPFAEGNTEVSHDEIGVYVDESNERVVNVVTPSGTASYTVVSGPVLIRTSPTIVYEWIYQSDQGDRLQIHRNNAGGIWGRIYGNETEVFSPTFTQHRIRGNFLYGWPIDLNVAATGAVGGIATFTGAGDLYTSDGRRMFGGTTNLTANFNNNTISGDLFRATGDPDNQEMAPTVTLTNGTMMSDGTISATNGIQFTSVNGTGADPISSISVSSSTLSGRFVGNASYREAIGSFGGSGTAIKGSGNEPISFSGLFRGSNN